MYPPFLPTLLQKNDHLPPFSLAKYRIHMENHLKEELTESLMELNSLIVTLRRFANG